MSPQSNPKSSSSGRPQSLSRTRRLLHSWEFRRFFNQSEVFRLSECQIFRVKNDFKHFRLGITLKARGSSVDRNKVKRQIRESFRRLAEALGSYDYNVVVPRTKKLSHPYPRKLGVCLREEFSRQLQRK